MALLGWGPVSGPWGVANPLPERAGTPLAGEGRVGGGNAGGGNTGGKRSAEGRAGGESSDDVAPFVGGCRSDAAASGWVSPDGDAGDYSVVVDEPKLA